MKERYVYGIVLADCELASETRGIQGQEVRKASSGRVAAVLSDLEPTDMLGSPEDLLAHTSVLDSIIATDPVLPLAFGTVVTGDTEVDSEVIEPLEERYFEGLMRLGGQAQYSLRVRFERDVVLREIVEEDAEAADLRAAIAGTTEDATRPQRIRLGEIVVKALERKSPSESAPILHKLEQVVTEASVREGRQADDVLDVAVLVDHSMVAEFESVVEELAQEKHERMAFRLVGPQAPYDFVPEV